MIVVNILLHTNESGKVVRVVSFVPANKRSLPLEPSTLLPTVPE